MASKAPAILLSAILMLAGGAVAVIVADGLSGSERAEKREEFQRLVGGLGFGPETDLSRCAFCFDPRLCPACPKDLGPIPVGTWMCRHHGCSIFFFSPLTGKAGAEDGESR